MAMPRVNPQVVVALCSAAVTAMLFTLFGTRPAEPKGVFALVVTVKFKSVADVEEFKRLFKPMAEFVLKNEPNTLSYEVFASDKSPTEVLIFERYKTKDDYLITHKSSKDFQDFRPKFGALGGEITGQSYYQTDVGFMAH